MSTRFCTSCKAEVQDADGYCLIGHDLSLKPATPSLSELRAEVDRAFEEARVSVATAMVPPPPPPAAAPAPSAPLVAAPPPPGLPREERATRGPRTPRVFEILAHDVPDADPIMAFAPAPRMDWGPESSVLRRRRRSA